MASPGSPQRRLVFDAVLLGIAGAACAWIFNALLRLTRATLLEGIAGYRAPGLPSEGQLPVEVIGAQGLWIIPLVTTLAGLLVGLLVLLSPEAEGHGTDAVVKSFHRHGGRLRARVAPLKLLASAITIGSGGSAGREGPIALAAAAVASRYADWTRRTEAERRLLLLVGAAAGVSAIFRSPIGAALFAVEILYADMEFEASVPLYATLAAIVAYALSGLAGGFSPLFVVPVEQLALERPLDYGWYAILGFGAGLLATLLPVVFYRTRDLFRAMPVHAALKPAIGGLLTGLIGLALPQVLSGGYGWIQQAIDGRLSLGILLALAMAKILSTSLTVASGGSGGVFAPSLFVGAMLGGACAAIAHLPPAPFAVVGMAAVFGGAAHVPFATMMMVTEMTGGYALLVPAALAVLLSFLVQRRLSSGLRYGSIYEAQVRSRGESPAHHTQHLEIALKILREQQLSNLDHVGNLDLVSLLRSGVPVDIGDGRRLLVGVLRPDSSFANASISKSGAELASTGTHLIVVLRQERMLGPRADMVLQAGDRVVLVTSESSLPILRSHFDEW